VSSPTLFIMHMSDFINKETNGSPMPQLLSRYDLVLIAENKDELKKQ
jgi:hypothetical protein